MFNLYESIKQLNKGVKRLLEARPPTQAEIAKAYEIFDLKPGSDLSNLNNIWKTLARKNHPDLGGSLEKMTDINWAKDILSDLGSSPSSANRPDSKPKSKAAMKKKNDLMFKNRNLFSNIKTVQPQEEHIKIIKDIVSKSGNNESKIISLFRALAKTLVKNKEKRRALIFALSAAALRVLPSNIAEDVILILLEKF